MRVPQFSTSPCRVAFACAMAHALSAPRPHRTSTPRSHDRHTHMSFFGNSRRQSAHGSEAADGKEARKDGVRKRAWRVGREMEVKWVQVLVGGGGVAEAGGGVGADMCEGAGAGARCCAFVLGMGAGIELWLGVGDGAGEGAGDCDGLDWMDVCEAGRATGC